MTAVNPALPVGDLQFYDNYVPALAAGTWRLEVDHTLDGIATGDLGATQQVVVSAPQFALDTTAILNQYPPAGSTGMYAEVLPHVVLNDALLPWERTGAQPWLALIVLGPDDLADAGGGADPQTGLQTTTVTEFLAPQAGVLKPAITQEADVAGTDPCTYVQLSTTTFTAIMPRAGDLPFLAHCRQSNIADKAEQGLEQNGLFSAVIANRFPAPGTADAPQKHVAHLVSVEGLQPYLVDQPSFGAFTSVAVLSLASWTFNCVPDQAQDFRGLAEGLVAAELDGTTYTPDDLLLRLTPPQPIDTGTPAGAEAARRIADGFVPMTYQLRTGEQTAAWYRGPCVPVLTTPLADTTTAFPTADSALIYQAQYGVFDTSLAVAWEAGRAAALADRGFGQALFDFRRRGHQVTDLLLERLQSDAFSADQIASLSTDTLVQDELLTLLSTDLLTAIGSEPQVDTDADTAQVAAATDTDPPDANPQAAVQAFLEQPDAQATLADLAEDDLTPVAAWLGRLLLLYPLPFTTLVPDQRLLPPESLRFFYLDQNWLRAAIDGATSIGVQTSRDSFYDEIMQDVVVRSAQSAAAAIRAQAVGADPPPDEAAEGLISGFLLRSGLVSGWPNLAVRPGMDDGTTLRTLRLSRLSADTMLCLAWGVPDFVELAEPQEGFRFGVDQDGDVPLRAPLTGGKVPFGTQLGGPLNVLPGSLRAGGLGVVDVLALVAAIEQGLSAAGVPVGDFGPADLALQMAKSPEAIRFTAQTQGTT